MFVSIIVVMYIMVNVIANLFVTQYGQQALVWTAFILIPFDLASRDILHDRWKNDNLKLKLGLLIAVSGVVTFIINAGAIRIAIASTTAFVCAAIIDTFVYQKLIDKKIFVRMNVSNFFSSATDSIIFPLIAFTSINLTLSAAQTGLKFSGGLLWSLALSSIYVMIQKKTCHIVV